MSIPTNENKIQRNTDVNRTHKKYVSVFGEFETQLIWSNIIAISIFHIVSFYTLLDYPYISKLPLLGYSFFIGVSGGFGITAGAHRLWSHRSYKAKWPLTIILLICFSMSGQNSLKDWVRDHRVHHKYSETDADPHNSKRGFFFAHVGWLMMKKHPDVIKKGKTVDCSDLFQDPLVAFHQKYFIFFKIFLSFIIPMLIPPLLWGESWYWTVLSVSFGRYCISLHCTWSVNSLAHLWGYRPYNKNINPAENLTVSFIAMGEGWHNYHHTFPWDYKTSEIGKLNLTKLIIDLFAKIGWAYDLRTPSDKLIREVILNRGDGSHETEHEDKKEYMSENESKNKNYNENYKENEKALYGDTYPDK